MKKTVLFFLVLILSTAAAFASGWIGVDTGANIMWTNMKMDMGEESLSVSGSEIDYYLGLSGAHYFTDSVGKLMILTLNSNRHFLSSTDKSLVNP